MSNNVKVSIKKADEDLKATVTKAMRDADCENVILPGDSVLIKPNLSGCNIKGSTSVPAIKALAQWAYDSGAEVLNLRKQQVKGKKEARSIPLNTDAKAAIKELVDWISQQGETTADTPLFPSQVGGDRITRMQGHRILKRAYEDAGLTGKVTTHSLRKSFGTKIYTVTKDIMVTKELLGHANVNTTQKYIGVGMDALRAAVDAI